MSLRVFVTGATGFIGRHLCERLAARGDRVVALVRNPAKAGHLPPGTEIVRGDLGLFADPATVLPQCDVVIHLAGLVAADRLAAYEEINFDAVKDLLACLGRQSWAPRRLLLASSLAAAGPSSRDSEWTEEDALHPIDPYGAAKARAEGLMSAAPFPTTVFRPPVVFGPGDEATLTLFRSARSGVGIRVAGSPQRLSFVDVRDLVDAIVRMADDTRGGSFVYYASYPQFTDVPQLWVELGRAVGRGVAVVPLPKFLLYVAMLASTVAAKLLRFKNQLDAKQYAQMVAPAFLCSGERLRTELGWQPRHDLGACLTHAATGYRSAGMLRGG